jgi:hypothetical protein
VASEPDFEVSGGGCLLFALALVVLMFFFRSCFDTDKRPLVDCVPAGCTWRVP